MTDQSVSDRKRTSILDAARRVFSQKGYAQAAVEDVAEEARVAKGTLYLYFKSKEELYLAALISDLEAMLVKAREEITEAGTFREKLRAFLEVRLDYCKSRQDFLRIYLAEYGSMFVKAQNPYLVQLLRTNMRYLAKVITEAIERREIAPVPAGALAAAVYDISRGLMERRLLGWKEFRAQDEIEFTLDLLLAGVGPCGSAAGKRTRRELRGRDTSA
jgi:AcrR family transcriptional regulator